MGIFPEAKRIQRESREGISKGSRDFSAPLLFPNFAVSNLHWLPQSRERLELCQRVGVDFRKRFFPSRRKNSSPGNGHIPEAPELREGLENAARDAQGGAVDGDPWDPFPLRIFHPTFPPLLRRPRWIFPLNFQRFQQQILLRPLNTTHRPRLKPPSSFSS